MVIPELHPFFAEGLAAVVLVLAGLAEWWHAGRVRQLAHLAFGPSRRPAVWARAAPGLRVLAIAAVTWGLATLLMVEPRRYSTTGADVDARDDYHHILLVLDVSPSMRLVDAGPQHEISRMQRARQLVESFFERIPLDRFRVSVVAVYNGAKPVVVDTRDFEVVRNILGDLPMHYAFQSGRTTLLDGLEEAARLAKPWNPQSTTVMLISDGDTVPTSGMPRMPASVRSTLIIGVGDPKSGKFIDGRQSRQDIPTLRQIAARLGGTFHNGNEKHVASTLIADATGLDPEDIFERLTRREYALIAAGLGSVVLGVLPMLLHLFGTRWRPGPAGRRPKEARNAGLAGYPVPMSRVV